MTCSPSVDPGAYAPAAHECAEIAADLARLNALIADAGDRLLASFNTVSAALPGFDGGEPQQIQLRDAVAAAVTSLQFQDLAAQLIRHAQHRLDVLSAHLRALPAPAADGLPVAAPRPQPVAQGAMCSGPIELF